MSVNEHEHIPKVEQISEMPVERLIIKQRKPSFSRLALKTVASIQQQHTIELPRYIQQKQPKIKPKFQSLSLLQQKSKIKQTILPSKKSTLQLARISPLCESESQTNLEKIDFSPRLEPLISTKPIQTKQSKLSEKLIAILPEIKPEPVLKKVSVPGPGHYCHDTSTLKTVTSTRTQQLKSFTREAKYFPQKRIITQGLLQEIKLESQSRVGPGSYTSSMHWQCRQSLQPFNSSLARKLDLVPKDVTPAPGDHFRTGSCLRHTRRSVIV